MKKSIWIFLLAVLLPSIALGWLALRSAEEQQIILEKRTAELYQTETENAATAARALIDGERRAFNEVVRQLLTDRDPQKLANTFSTELAKEWQRKAIGFALGKEGQICAPPPKQAASNPEWSKFLLGNGAWLAGTTPATVYWVSGNELNRPEQLRQKRGGNYDVQQSAQPQAANQKEQAASEPAGKDAPPAEKSAGFNQSDTGDNKQTLARNVEPQQVFNTAALSQLMSSTADFRALTSDTNEGVITRFVQDQLDIIFWLRPAQAPEMVFGCLIDSDNLRDLWPAALRTQEENTGSRYASRSQPEFVLALLDDKARPIATQPPGEAGRDWKRPFVASEIGEALPHWEAALYLQRPEQVRESAKALRRTLTFLIATALGAIACGGWLVVADARRQLALAQQKTDFVSNVSHELKTPLTSIRMFAELMQNGNGTTAKHPQYLRIIMVEAERLTRLINNVLDFAGLERKQKRFEKKPLDLHAVIGRAWEGHALHLQESGFSTRWEAAPAPYPVVGDEDALAQILVNLLSNAEKYAGERKEVELHTYLDGAHVCVSVLDRGCGVHDGEERKIFEAFYRAHDSLSSGIQGSGLGLTLAQRLAHEHGGEITYQPREGGGSNFTLRLPLAKQLPIV
ncbi:MAG: HAMP domain-containing histidine kinase [Chthoniobacter sp.]|nr:HAMP domain-containing histidine kinase [Chthoniobacter sp.]